MRLPKEIAEIIRSAFSPLRCSVEFNNSEDCFRFVVYGLDDSEVLVEPPERSRPEAWRPVEPLHRNDTELERYLNDARHKVEEKTKSKLHPLRIPPGDRVCWDKNVSEVSLYFVGQQVFPRFAQRKTAPASSGL
jgi:hypothetical protein